jgi:hypothetical protein
MIMEMKFVINMHSQILNTVSHFRQIPSIIDNSTQLFYSKKTTLIPVKLDFKILTETFLVLNHICL